MEQVLEGPLWEALWPYMYIPKIFQMCVTAQTWNNAGMYGPDGELFFFVMKHEPADGEAPVSSHVGLCDDMRVGETRGAEP